MTGSEPRRCLTCYRVFEENSVLEHLPVARTVAFDPVRGRLWAICSSCSRWTLVPFESRWEALEELERRCRDSGRLLKQGEQMALFRLESMSVVRIGRAQAREEAWWRYGEGFLEREVRARRAARRGRIADTIKWIILTGLPIWASDSEAWVARARDRSFGRDIWKGRSQCPRCGDVLQDVRFFEFRDLVLEPGEGRARLWYSCPRCGADDTSGGHRWAGRSAEHLMRRGLAYENFAGAGLHRVNAALDLVGSQGHPAALVESLAMARTPIGRLTEVPRMAAEIALNAEFESELLGDSVAELEARWREEEVLAAIIDGELQFLGRASHSGGSA